MNLRDDLKDGDEKFDFREAVDIGPLHCAITMTAECSVSIRSIKQR